ncbi:hypothetical protein ILUMI_07153, partial [Ignelater luminosus]
FTNESIDFLSNLLQVEPEFLQAAPVPMEIKPETENDDTPKGYALIKKLQKENRQVAQNHLPPVCDSASNLKEVCEEICISTEILNHTRNKRKKRVRRRLISKIRLESCLRNIDTELVCSDVFKELPCPLKFLSENLMLSENRYRRFRNKMLQIVKPILSHFKYRTTVLTPKKRFMCRPRIAKDKLMAFACAHPLLNVCSNNSSDKIEELVIADGGESLKRKGDNLENDDMKKIKLDDAVVNESFSSNIISSSIYMGPKPKVVYHHIDNDNVEITIMKSTAPEEFDSAGSKYIKDDNATLRTLKRASHIVNAVRQEKVITDIHKLHKMIEALDREEGYMVRVDKKSIERIYTRLVRIGHINILQIDLKLSGTRRNAVVICDPSVSIPHTMIDSVIEQMKVKFFLTSKKKEWEPSAPKTVPVEKDEIAFDSSEISNSVGELKQLSSNETSYVYNRNIGKDYGFAPKFMRLRLLHEFLFYVIYGNSTGQETGNVKQVLNDSNIVMDEDEIKEIPPMYCKEISWKMFIPPLPEHNGWPEGWALVCDLLLRLPLSLFVKVYNVSYIIPELPDYLVHPIKQFYLVKHLPLDIRNGLLLQRKYIFSIHESLQRLCYIGILQFGPQKLREKDQLFVYLNRNATLLDTTTNIAGYHYVEEKEYRELKYHFSSATDVETYWCDMWNICTNSKLGVRNIVAGTYITIELADTKPAMIEAMKPKTPETALNDDNGFVPGDKRGAAGLDSALWAHIKRNWNWSNRINKNKSQVYQKDTSTKEKCKIKPNRKSVKSKSKKSKKVTNINVELDSVAQSRRRTYKKTKIVTEKRESSAGGKKEKYFIRKVLPRPETKKKKDYDSIDKKLMAALKQSRSEWNENEDKILQICQIMSSFLCPNPRKLNIPYTVIRDILHKVSPCSINKTSSACHRRLNVIFGSQEGKEFLQQIIRSLRVVPFVKKYVSKTIDRIESNDSIPEKHLQGVFVFLVTYFYKHQYEISHIFEALAYRYKVIPSVQKTKEESFCNVLENNSSATESNLHIYSTSPVEVISYESVDLRNEKPKTSKLYPDLPEFPETERDVILDTIKSIIHSTVGTKQEEISWSYQLFRVYQNYSDEMLRMALTEIQNAQMVSHKRVYTKRQDSEGLLITTKLFQFSFSYSFAQITNFPLEIFVQAHEMLLGLAKRIEDSASVTEKSFPMECFEQGHSVSLAEISTNVKTCFNVDIPKEVLLLNPNIADHTELIRELAERYKKMLTLVKQGKYFKEDENETENQFSNNDGDGSDQVDGSKQDKAKYASSRQPMIQRFLKSWFLSDDVDETDEDVDSNKVVDDKKTQDEKKNALKSDKKKKHYFEITNEESKKILESLNPNLFSEKELHQPSADSTENQLNRFMRRSYSEPFHSIEENENQSNLKSYSEPLHSLAGNDLSFEDYEKKLENLLSDKTLMETDNADIDETFNDEEVVSTNDDVPESSSLALTDFSDSNTSILEKYLSSKRLLANEAHLSRDVVDSLISRRSVTNKSLKSNNTESDPVTNARIQYLMSEELTVEQIMEQMLEECSSDDRKVPKPVHLARLLVKGLFPELDEDEERLEQLHQHFLIICPDTNLLLSEAKTSKELKYLYKDHNQTCKNLLKKVQMDIIVTDNLTSTNEVINELKQMGGTDTDIHLAENLIDFVSKKCIIGASVKQIKVSINEFILFSNY